MKYTVCDYWEAGELRLFSNRSYDLPDALREVERRKAIWDGGEDGPNKIEIWALQAQYPVKLPDEASGDSSQASNLPFPNL